MTGKPETVDLTNHLINELLIKNSDELSQDTQNKIETITRSKLHKPAIYIGCGTCGIAAGANETIHAVNDYISLNLIDADVVEVGCVGLCSAEPLLDYQAPGKTRVCFQNITADKVAEVLDECFHSQISNEHVLGQIRHETNENWEGIPIINDLPFFKKQHRVLLYDCGEISPTSITEYIARGGYKSMVKTILNYPPDQVIDVIQRSGLRGRGGGGHPTANKWKAARQASGDQKYLVCNADESDPGAYMDRALIEGNPHRLIEGIIIAAYAIGAKKAYI
nr:NADH-quinone oxidoreductase subunit F [Bacteroidota bacterium]